MLCWALPSFAELCWALLKFIKLVGLTVACPGLCWVLLCVAFCFWFCCFGCCCFLLLLPLPCFSCLPLLRLAFFCFPLPVKALTALIHFRVSRSLLRQVSPVGHVGAFFVIFRSWDPDFPTRICFLEPWFFVRSDSPTKPISLCLPLNGAFRLKFSSWWGWIEQIKL